MAEQDIVRSGRMKSDNVSRGRPQSRITLNATAGDIVTLNLAIDLIQVRRINYAGELLHDKSVETDTRVMGKTQLVDYIFNLIDKVIAMQIGNPVQRIGVAFQGVTENASGNLAWSPIIQHENIALGQLLQTRFDLPVVVNNDCRLISEALSVSFKDKLGKSFATVLFSHGVGLGIYIDGKPFSGIHSSALELGHLRFERDGALCRCGRKGCIEAYASDYGIERLANGQSIHDTPSGRVERSQVEKLCASGIEGDKPTMQAFAIAGAAVGEGLMTIFTLFDPMPVALVGRSVEGFELMRNGLNSVFSEHDQDQPPTDDLLHCFDDAEPLLESGLTNNTLAILDSQFAYSNHATTR